MRVRVRPAAYGVGYLASSVGNPDDVIHAAGFDEAVVVLAAKQPTLCPPDGSPPRFDELTVTVVHEEYGEYLLDLTRRRAEDR